MRPRELVAANDLALGAQPDDVPCRPCARELGAVDDALEAGDRYPLKKRDGPPTCVMLSPPSATKRKGGAAMKLFTWLLTHPYRKIPQGGES
jgi:hypothetical protein